MAGDLSGREITVNVLLPGGPTLTGMVPREHRPDEVRFLDPAIMARPIIWLASTRATRVHDQRIIASEFESWLAQHENMAA
jgi:gluconate 5-dehydrogenase